MNMLDTDHKAVVPLSEAIRKCTITTQWLLEEGKDITVAPKLYHNNLQLLICGEEGFARIRNDIDRAEHSIDIICWGFDPAMELVRDGATQQWPRGDTWGDLLRNAAEGKLKRGKKIQVRLLPWWDQLTNAMGAHNMPGFMELTSAEKANLLRPGMAMPGAYPNGLPVDDARMEFNRRWFSDAYHGRIEGLSLRTRGSLHEAAVAVLENTGGLSPTERFGMEWAATHHQKTILIDYEGRHPVAYIMGLNSVTDYWDTRNHIFNDTRRGQPSEGGATDHSEGDSWDNPSANKHTLKPLQDYACRIKGEAVAAVCRNFDAAWNSARAGNNGSGTNIQPRVTKLVSGELPANLTQALIPPHSCVQVLRTLPAKEGAEQSIGRLYHHAIRRARHYIYVENQYFQHAGWTKAIKQARQQFLEAAEKCGLPAKKAPALHLLVVIPTPERAQMVPRTADTIAELGHGDSMPNHDKRIKDELAQHKAQEERWDEYRKQVRDGRWATYAPPPPQPLSEQAQDYLKAGGDQEAEQARENLKHQLGIRSVIASLWSCDERWNPADSKVGKEIAQDERRFEKQMRNWQKWQDYEKGLHRESPFPPMEKPVPPRDRSRDLANAAAERYREVYIHSKLMIIDDAMFTLGSANINLRSFTSDSEINMATDDPREAAKLRQRVWEQHTKSAELAGEGCVTDPQRMEKTFDNWVQQAHLNFDNKKKGKPLTSFLVMFQDKRTSAFRLG